MMAMNTTKDTGGRARPKTRDGTENSMAQTASKRVGVGRPVELEDDRSTTWD